MIFIVGAALLVNPAVAAGVGCSDLAGGLTLRGHEVGNVLAEICESWPFTEHPFPVETTHDAEVLLNSTFKEGGIYDRAKALARERRYSGDFCWRKEMQRPVVQPSGYSCPKIFDDMFIAEKPVDMLPTEKDGQLLCVKNCSDVCGSYVNKGEISPGLCGCRSKEPVEIGTAGYHFDFKQQPNTVPAVPDGCDSIMMVNHSNTCYGTCPLSSVPSFLVGNFKPVCSSMCNGTNRSFGCGFGCAVSGQKCASTVVDQVGETVQSIGDTLGYLTGNIEVASITTAVVATAEFGVTVLSTLVSAGITAWSHFEQEKQTVGLIAALLQLVKEIKAKMPQLKGLCKQFVKMVRSMIAALRGWHGIHWQSSLKEMADAFVKQGPLILLDAYELLEVFMWPTCTPEPRTHFFLV